jgi:hypothetical protein
MLDLSLCLKFWYCLLLCTFNYLYQIKLFDLNKIQWNYGKFIIDFTRINCVSIPLSNFKNLGDAKTIILIILKYF